MWVAHVLVQKLENIATSISDFQSRNLEEFCTSVQSSVNKNKIMSLALLTLLHPFPFILHLLLNTTSDRMYLQKYIP